MSEPKHTPGPWTWHQPSDPAALLVLRGADGTRVCDFGDSEQYYPTEGHEPSDEDAALIAAAPELADALEEALGLFSLGMSAGHPLSHGGYQKEADAIHERIRAALKKAGRLP